MYLCNVGGIVAQTRLEVIAWFVFAVDGATKVVTAINNITNPGEAVFIAAITVGLSTYINFDVTKNIGIAGATESIVDATVAQIDVSIAANVPLVTTAV